jgi:hypothetical protein
MGRRRLGRPPPSCGRCLPPGLRPDESHFRRGALWKGRDGGNLVRVTRGPQGTFVAVR